MITTDAWTPSLDQDETGPCTHTAPSFLCMHQTADALACAHPRRDSSAPSRSPACSERRCTRPTGPAVACRASFLRTVDPRLPTHRAQHLLSWNQHLAARSALCTSAFGLLASDAAPNVKCCGADLVLKRAALRVWSSSRAGTEVGIGWGACIRLLQVENQGCGRAHGPMQQGAALARISCAGCTDVENARIRQLPLQLHNRLRGFRLLQTCFDRSAPGMLRARWYILKLHLSCNQHEATGAAINTGQHVLE